MRPRQVQVPGEDLTPYRAASKSIWSLLDKFGKVQHGGLDEAFLDATDEVLRFDQALHPTIIIVHFGLALSTDPTTDPSLHPSVLPSVDLCDLWLQALQPSPTLSYLSSQFARD